MKKLLLKSINAYQKYSKFFYTRAVCAFYPSCSEYAKEAIEKYGARRGAFLAVKRILRCHPWQKNHIDPLK